MQVVLRKTGYPHFSFWPSFCPRFTGEGSEIQREGHYSWALNLGSLHTVHTHTLPCAASPSFLLHIWLYLTLQMGSFIFADHNPIHHMSAFLSCSAAFRCQRQCLSLDTSSPNTLCLKLNVLHSHVLLIEILKRKWWSLKEKNDRV